MPPRRAPRRQITPPMPDGHFNNPARRIDNTCGIDHCGQTGVLYAAGTRCPAHKPDYEKYLAEWLGGFHKGGTP